MHPVKTPGKHPDRPGWITFAVILAVVAALHLLAINVLWRERGNGQDGAAPGKVEIREGRDAAPLLMEAGKLMQAGSFQEALQKYERILELYPGSARALEGKGQALIWLKRWKKAIDPLSRLIEMEPANVDGLLNRSRAYLELGDMARYVEDRRLAQKAAPGMMRANLELGRALSWVDRSEEALEYLNKAQELARGPREQAVVMTSRAYVYKHTGDPNTAEALLLKSREMGADGNRIQCTFMLIGVFLDKDENEKAALMLEEYKRLDPEFKLSQTMGDEIKATHFRNLGSVSMSMGDYPTALKAYGKSLEMEPDNRDGLAERALVYLMTGDRQRARQDAEKWKQTSPPPPKTQWDFNRYAMISAITGDREKALCYINRAMALDPKNSSHLRSRGFIRLIFHDKEGFKKDYEAFMKTAGKKEREFFQKRLDDLKAVISKGG
jgi:tetratricopeptide (TPR) repeat protein